MDTVLFTYLASNIVSTRLMPIAFSAGIPDPEDILNVSSVVGDGGVLCGSR